MLGALAQGAPEHERRERGPDPRHDQSEERVAQQRRAEDAEEQRRGDRGDVGDDERAGPEGDARRFQLGVEPIAEPARIGEPLAEPGHVVGDPPRSRDDLRPARRHRLLCRSDDGAHPRLDLAILLRPRRPPEQHPRQEERDQTDHPRDEDLRGGERREGVRQNHQTPLDSSAKSSGSTYTPRSASLSRNLGRRPVDFRRPLNRPSSSIPAEKSNRKMSCSVITSPSIPATSVTCVKRRVPSFRRCWYTISWIAEAICSRIARFESSIPAIIVMVSRRLSASRGLLQWIVLTDPS